MISPDTQELQPQTDHEKWTVQQIQKRSKDPVLLQRVLNEVTEMELKTEKEEWEIRLLALVKQELNKVI